MRACGFDRRIDSRLSVASTFLYPYQTAKSRHIRRVARRNEELVLTVSPRSDGRIARLHRHGARRNSIAERAVVFDEQHRRLRVEQQLFDLHARIHVDIVSGSSQI